MRIVSIVGFLVLLTAGCGGGNAGAVLRGVDKLTPEAEKKAEEIRDLANPTTP